MHTDDFLPSEYVEHRVDRRTNALGMALFLIVVAGVGCAFAWKQWQWSKVAQLQTQVEAQWIKAGEQVEAISALEARQATIHERAQIAASLVERLPRSTILAEFINRMPAGLGLIEIELHSRALAPPATVMEQAGRSLRAPDTEAPASGPPRHVTDVSMLGFAPTDLQVSAFLAQLNAHAMLQDVVLQFSEETEMAGQTVRQFRVQCSFIADADFRDTSPLHTAMGAMP
ncbi:MAG: PilN domain-containing protein [Phycisphaerales bacterium]|nr:PilN domain-containing protein [Phycisphaerales bacterium]